MTKAHLNPHILIVDDKTQNLFALAKILQNLDAEIVQASSGSEALLLALEYDFCLAIVDVQMPEMDGYELVELLRGNENTETLPVIFVSAIYSDEYHHRKGYDAGAVDFLSKPFNPDILLSKVRVFLELYHQRLKLQDMVNQLAEANKTLSKLNASKDKFFSIVAHDLRGPFHPLLGMSELLFTLADTAPRSEMKEMGDGIHRTLKSVYNLLENLLQWSQLERGRMQYRPDGLDLKRIVAPIIELFAENTATKGINLQSAVIEGIFVYVDKNMLDTVIRNLISNALKFTPPNGQITISARPGNLSSEFVQVSVADTGVGISQEDLTKLFNLEIHHTTAGTAHEKGTGLGLILCQEMIEKNGGKIWIESKLGQGTTIKFTIPLDKSNPITIPWPEQDVAKTTTNDVNEVAENPSPVREELLLLPPPEALNELLELALRGNMIALAQQADQLEAMDEQLAPFTKKLRYLAKNFEDDKILTWLNNIGPEQ